MLAPLRVDPPVLLGGHPVFTSCDIDQAREQVARVFCPHGLQQTRTAQRLDCHFHRVGLGSLSINYLAYGAEVDITPGYLDNFYLVQIPLAGQADIRYGTQDTQSDCSAAVILSPYQPVSMRWRAGCAQVLLYIPRALMEKRTAEMFGAHCARLEYEPKLAQCDSPTAGWCQTVVDLARNIDAHGTGWLQHEAAVASVQDFLMRSLLTLQPHNHSQRLQATPPLVLPRHMQRAQEFMDAFADQPLTVADIARAACVSVRALEEGFRRHRNTTPLAHLRELRLLRIRDHLRTAARSGVQVSLFEVAYRYGFFHLGRFAAYYKARFGETPSATLGRR